ncbi:MAG TPA: HD domain-containing phosphohydrolase, partial [bacterium]|nr:HD domain-containing phosphohydrolase [bacterium]
SADFLMSADKLALANLARAARDGDDVLYARIVDARGQLRASTPTAVLEVPYDPPSDIQPLGGDQAVSVQRYYNGRQWVEDVMVPVMVGQQRAGLVAIGMDEAAVDRAVDQAQQKLWVVGLMVLGAALVLALASAVLLARPLERLTRAVGDLGGGLMQTRVRASGPVELKQLGDSFNLMAERLEAATRGSIQALARALAEHDQVAPGHAERVSRLGARTAKTLGLGLEEQELIRLAGQLIDIGHMGMPANMLHKVEPLSDDELRRLRAHPQVGVRIIEPLQALKPVVPLLMHHHERYDGRGYPLGLKGDAIPQGARILAVADAFDAMLSEKRHRRARSQAEAVRELERCAGQQFDPKVVKAFIQQLTAAA